MKLTRRGEFVFATLFTVAGMLFAYYCVAPIVGWMGGIQ